MRIIINMFVSERVWRLISSFVLSLSQKRLSVGRNASQLKALISNGIKIHGRTLLFVMRLKLLVRSSQEEFAVYLTLVTEKMRLWIELHF